MIVPRLDKLPQELIEQIASKAVVRFDDVTDDFLPDKLADLAHLSRTCKRLYDACAPTLFRRVTFQWSDRRILYFLQSLIVKPYLREYVRAFKARGGTRGEEKALNKVAEAVLESDPVALLLLQGQPWALWDIVTALTLKLLPDLVALTTSPAVMQLVTRWPEKQRLRGLSISDLQLVHGMHQRRTFDNYCQDMFQWKQSFQPGTTPVALHSLHLDHRNCQAPTLRGNHAHHELDAESLKNAASLRRLDLQSWLSRYGERACVARLIGTLDKCTSLTHLTFREESAFLKEMLDIISESTTLTRSLQTLEMRMEWAKGLLDTHTLSQLSKFTHVRALTLPWIEVDEDFLLDSTIWPPSLESLTLSVTAIAVEVHSASLQTMIEARQFPATMRDITFKWFIVDIESDGVQWILELFDFSRALDKEFASSGIALLHEHGSLDDLGRSGPIFTSTSIERE